MKKTILVFSSLVGAAVMAQAAFAWTPLSHKAKTSQGAQDIYQTVRSISDFRSGTLTTPITFGQGAAADSETIVPANTVNDIYPGHSTVLD